MFIVKVRGINIRTRRYDGCGRLVYPVVDVEFIHNNEIHHASLGYISRQLYGTHKKKETLVAILNSQPTEIRIFSDKVNIGTPWEKTVGYSVHRADLDAWVKRARALSPISPTA